MVKVKLLKRESDLKFPCLMADKETGDIVYVFNHGEKGVSLTYGHFYTLIPLADYEPIEDDVVLSNYKEV